MNKLAIMAAAAATVVTFGAAGVYAEGTGGNFAAADGNKDGIVTMAEAVAAIPTLTQDQFNKADTNGDGKLDEAEFGSLGGLPNGDLTQASSNADSSAAMTTATPSSNQGSSSISN